MTHLKDRVLLIDTTHKAFPHEIDPIASFQLATRNGGIPMSVRSVIICVIAAVALCIGLAGCGADSKSAASSSSAAEAESSASSDSSKSSENVAKITDNTTKKTESSSGSSSSSGAKTFALGDTIATENYEITLSTAEWVDEIYPPDTSGYYRYYEDEEGKTYLVVKGSYKNLWTDYTEPHWATEATFVFNDKYNLKAQIEDIENGAMSTSYAIDPMETCEIYIWTSVSDEMKDSMTKAELVWNIPDDNLSSFYRSSAHHDTYRIAL